MRQFDIVRLSDKQLCVVVQHDLLSDRKSRIVAPLMPMPDIIPTERLHPVLRVGRRDYIVAMDQMGAVGISEIGRVVGSARAIEYEIRRAYDIVIGGI